jgi:hypothetical protein
MDEAFDAVFWNRLAHVMEHPPALAGEPACFHPLVLRTVGRLLDQESWERSHSYRAILLGTRRGMPVERSEFSTVGFLSRTAERMDEEIEDIRERFEGTLDMQGCFIPGRIKDKAAKGGVVAEMYEA